MRLIYAIIREPQTTFEPLLKRTLNLVVTQLINKQGLAQFKNIVKEFFDEFFDTNTDGNVDDNLRWAIMNKIIMPILETCDQNQLSEIMIDYTKKFEERLSYSFSKARETEDPTVFYNLVKEKSHVLLCFEVMFRRLKADVIKTTVHKRIYGEGAQGNEITKFLIQLCAQAKKGPIEGFIMHTAQSIQTEFKTLNSPH